MATHGKSVVERGLKGKYLILQLRAEIRETGGNRAIL